MRFILNGRTIQLDAAAVHARLRGVPPEPVRKHGVLVGDIVYPVRQAFEVATGLPRTEFTSHTALRHLQGLGFPIQSEPVPAPITEAPAGSSWPWEGAVQAVFCGLLIGHGWTIASAADTATKATGVDVLAQNGNRHLGAEVKGWPSTGYADPRRADETKPTQPSTQAGHWFSQALFKAMLLLDSHPGYESLLVLPDFPRYRDLAARTRTGRRAADIHVVLLDPRASFTSEWWSP
jgi:hypothetical protein